MGRRRKTLAVDEWMEAGRKIKKIGILLQELVTLVNGKIPMPLLDRILKLCNHSGHFSGLKSRLEDEMFRQHPELSNEYLWVFYGQRDPHPETECKQE